MTDEERTRDMNEAIALIEGVIDDILMEAHHAKTGPLSALDIARQTPLYPAPYHTQFITCVAKIMEEKGCLVNHGTNSVSIWTTAGTLYGRDIREKDRRL